MSKNKKEIINLKNKKDITLLVTFIILLITVICLFIKVISLKNEKAIKKDTRITIPITEKHQNSEIIIDLSQIGSKNKTEYVFAVSNYNKNVKTKSKLNYNIKIDAPKDIKLRLYKNDNDKNILKENNIVENNIIQKNKKQNDIYKLIIPELNSPKKGDEIKVKIES